MQQVVSNGFQHDNGTTRHSDPAQSIADQEAVVAFLSSPEAYGDGTRKVDVITTHGAKVFLSKRDVYKIKQAVSYDYMDFSSLDQRRVVCRRELEINKPFAPSIYRDVVSITRDVNGKLSIDGKGEVVEWAVHMNRFPEDKVLERIAERGEMTDELSALLGKQIADYHRNLAKGETQDGALRIEEIINELNDAFADRDLDIDDKLAREFKGRTKALFEAECEHLDIRAGKGLVRRCHGDLHLRNIVMIEGVPTPFDALEFDERLATTDILYDVAFLIMDMLHRGLHRQANVVFNRYVYFSWSLIEAHGFDVLPMFMAIRSAIRTMVCSQTALRNPASALALSNDSENYLLESLAFMNPDEPKLIAVGGLSGTGKSTLSAALAPELGSLPGAFLLRSDLERKKMLKAEEFDQLPAEAYNPIANRHVYERIFDKARVALMQGQSVVLDAVFSKAKNRRKAAKIAEGSSVPFCGLWLDAPDNVLIERVKNRHKDASDADVTVVQNQLATHRSLGPVTSNGWHKVDASSTIEETLRNANLRIQHTFHEGGGMALSSL